ncbi:hypothetical protein BCR39DRAFT_539027 [Naematelia encephala]|uniref:ubiquitinyl hydrolase 1 n=1 Tax=Naematelia encephala TaxID=71784 RepID=A0A1Y2AXD2_9TREE|nr:hypothetical protein BCR39DRAFT_539027 [Naematelia encephala]
MTTSPSITPRPSISGPPTAPEYDSPRNHDVPSSPSSGPIARPPPPAAGLPRALKPIGIVNEQNTCFLNSTFQALSSTAPLISLLTASSESVLRSSPLTTLPPPVISPSLIPSLQPSALEPPIYQLLPVTRAFTNSLVKAWKMKDAGGGTTGSAEMSPGRSMSLRNLLKELARKYDQYDDYAQQDAHELLRHLLDSMEMEEKDVIKRLQPQPPLGEGRRKYSANAVSPMVSPLPSPVQSGPSSPIGVRFDESATPMPGRSGRDVADEDQQVPQNERMVPFTDVLFGGSLASVVVCESCRSVSHTYEGFLDISLSLKGDEPRARKRDRLKAMASKLRPGKPSKTPSDSSLSHNHSVYSESEISDNEHRNPSRRNSLDQDDRPVEGANLSRNSSAKGFGIKNKASFSFRRSKGSRPGSSTSSSIQPSAETEKPPPVPSIPNSPVNGGKVHGIGPTPAQAAYIQRILSGPVAADPGDPLARLRAANSGDLTHIEITAETGLLESLKAFTSVEVLEGDNAFACKKCWKIKTGRYPGGAHQPTVKEEDEEDDGTMTSPAVLSSRRVVPPSISIVGSDSGSDRVSSPLEEDNLHLGRAGSMTSQASSSSARRPRREPSPLRRQLADGLERSTSIATSSYADQSSIASITERSSINSDTTRPVHEHALQDDGLSDTDSSDEEPPHPSELPIGRPRMPARRKSTHFVLRRAFKRYLIAKAPEVLVFHFKRFKQTQKTSLTFTSFYDLKKVDDFISFPETFDLAPFLTPNRNDYKVVPTSSGPRAPYMDWPSPEHGPEMKPVMYKLYALVVHLGTMIGGHYVAYCLVDPDKMFTEDTSTPVHAMNGLKLNGDGLEESHAAQLGPKKDKRVWCFCSDTSIRLASVEEVLKARAYLCFYERVVT